MIKMPTLQLGFIVKLSSLREVAVRLLQLCSQVCMGDLWACADGALQMSTRIPLGRLGRVHSPWASELLLSGDLARLN